MPSASPVADSCRAVLTEIAGEFCKIAFAADAGIALCRGAAGRPPSRFNRAGQDALYISPDVASARVAISQYLAPGDPPRVLLRFEVGRCEVVDLRHPEAAELYELARQPWRKTLSEGKQPVSWQASDRLRHEGYFGLIDPSRQRPGLWHVTLFRWNEPGAPHIARIGEPEPIETNLSRRVVSC